MENIIENDFFHYSANFFLILHDLLFYGTII